MTALLGCALALSPLASARSLAQKKALALAQFNKAEQMREALNGRPQSDRSAHEYQRVIAAYQKVYLITPNSSRSDASIVAAAELLAEEGRALDDADASRDSIKQYKFLMEQYPGSRHRTEAMFTIGKIYQEDLNDGPAAKAQFEDFLKAHPRHPLSQQARDAIDEIEHPKPAVQAKNSDVRKKSKAETRANTVTVSKNAKPDEQAGVEEEESKSAEAPVGGKRPLVTGIRHWSTPDYTRVAIDLEQEVKYEAGRIPSPDRIFFDLHGTKLAPELVGKSFDVDDGFLQKIRVAQYQPGMTRVVLEVPPVSEYSAFMLPNPYRLIIDIHGRQPAPTLTAKAKPEAAANVNGAAPSAAKPAPVANQPVMVAKVTGPKTPPAEENWSSSKRGADVSAKAAEAHAANIAPVPASNPAPVSNKVKTVSDQAPAEPNPAKPSASDSPADDDKNQEVRATAHPTTAPTFQEVTPRPASDKNRSKEFTQLAHEAKPSSDGQRTLIRALGLKIGKIVVDAGHGGHDTGTIGPRGLEEKDLVLDVALRLGKLLENKMGADVVYTRSDDTFIPLETRTAIANQEQADLFISVHANSSRDPGARGVETYYLNFTSSADALEVAARENAVSETSIHELQDLVKKIALKEKIEESHEFAADVQHALQTGLSTRGNSMRDRGVKKAPFIVLIGANMPSILAEISFVSNPRDEKKLQTPEYRQKIAESLYRGVADYVRGLSGVKLAAAGAAAK